MYNKHLKFPFQYNDGSLSIVGCYNRMLCLADDDLMNYLNNFYFWILFIIDFIELP